MNNNLSNEATELCRLWKGNKKNYFKCIWWLNECIKWCLWIGLMEYNTIAYYINEVCFHLISLSMRFLSLVYTYSPSLLSFLFSKTLTRMSNKYLRPIYFPGLSFSISYFFLNWRMFSGIFYSKICTLRLCSDKAFSWGFWGV